MKTIVLDCETTGLTKPSSVDLSQQPQIIELALAVIEDGALLSEHEWLINPGKPLTEEIIKITRITDDMLADKPAFPAVLPEIIGVFAGADQLVAHNASFDTACLTYELQRCGCADFPWPERTTCTVQEYVHEFGHRPRLTQLYERKIGKPLDQKHRAMSDVQALVEILLKEQLA
jgi:DNA polymerase-3 subunit alpha (Gram-positive type)